LVVIEALMSTRIGSPWSGCRRRSGWRVEGLAPAEGGDGGDRRVAGGDDGHHPGIGGPGEEGGEAGDVVAPADRDHGRALGPGPVHRQAQGLVGEPDAGQPVAVPGDRRRKVGDHDGLARDLHPPGQGLAGIGGEELQTVGGVAEKVGLDQEPGGHFRLLGIEAGGRQELLGEVGEGTCGPAFLGHAIDPPRCLGGVKRLLTRSVA
jgi:hypothetical protein